MADIRIDFQGNLTDGQVITFQAPCDCTAVDALKIYYVNGEEKLSRRFIMKDAHGNNLVGVGNLFGKDAYIKVILDTTNGFAYLQNADTNKYLEERFNKLSVKTLHINSVVTDSGGHLSFETQLPASNYVLLGAYCDEALSLFPMMTQGKWNVRVFVNGEDIVLAKQTKLTNVVVYYTEI